MDEKGKKETVKGTSFEINYRKRRLFGECQAKVAKPVVDNQKKQHCKTARDSKSRMQ